jgi:hypothetical protein
MRTTVEIDSDLIAELKQQGLREGLSLRKVLNAALRRGLTTPSSRTQKRYRCPVFPMGTPLGAKVDLNKALALAGALEDLETVRKLEMRK